jgi:transposase
MPRASALRPDVTATQLRGLARRAKDAAQARRRLALAGIYDGGSRTEAARLGNVRLGNVTLQIVRDWVLRFNAEGPEGLLDRKAPGPTPRRIDTHRAALADIVDRRRPRPGPGHPWRRALAPLRSRPVAVGRIPGLGLDPDAEPGVARHGLPQARGAAEAPCPGRWRHRGIQNNFPATLAGIAKDQGIGLDAGEVWFADEARVGQKSKITRRWARRGSRPAAPQDQRTASAYIFGAVCPREGKGAALVLPFCTSAAMSLQLAEVSAMVAPGRHAVLLLDQAGWHLSSRVEVPPNITLLPLPPKCPELNVMENGWQFMRDNWLSNRLFRDHDDIVAHCCHHWNRLIDQPWRIMSIGMRDWAHRF